MPLEIRELVIKASVNGGTAQSGGSGQEGGAAAENIDAIVAVCVEQVLAILKDRSER